MTLTDKIFSHIENLPESYQAEILDFVEFLANKSKRRREQENEDGAAWSYFSLEQAMRGMENEDDLYSLDDLEAAY